VHPGEINVMEQRYQAVMAVVQDGWKITEVAERLGVSRPVHRWIARYETGGLAALERAVVRRTARSLMSATGITRWQSTHRAVGRSEQPALPGPV
jgi:transposase